MKNLKEVSKKANLCSQIIWKLQERRQIQISLFMNSSVLTKLIVCKICTDPFIVGKIPRPSENYLLKTAAMPPFAHKDKLSKKTNNGLDLETCSRVRISS